MLIFTGSRRGEDNYGFILSHEIDKMENVYPIRYNEFHVFHFNLLYVFLALLFNFKTKNWSKRGCSYGGHKDGLTYFKAVQTTVMTY